MLLPWSAACNSLILRASTSPSLLRESTLPPLDYIHSLGNIWTAVQSLKEHFDTVFAIPLATASNILIACRDKRRVSFHKLDAATAQTLTSWTSAVIMHLARVLHRTQSKYDYAPKAMDARMSTGFGLLESSQKEVTMTHVVGGQQVTITSSTQKSASVSASPACELVCKALLVVSNTVRACQASLVGLNLEELLWKPLGEQLVGLVISHIRRQKITQEGSFVLMKDLEAYAKVSATLCRAETVDMLTCLKDLGFVFMISGSKVSKYVLEDLRHLDTHVVMALVRARADYVSQKFGRHWTRDLQAVYPLFHADPPLPWETTDKKSSATTAGLAATSIGGPPTLRKTTAPLTESRRLQIMRDVLVKKALTRANSNESLKAALEATLPRDDKALASRASREDLTHTAAAAAVIDENAGHAASVFHSELGSHYPRAAGQSDHSAPPHPPSLLTSLQLHPPAVMNTDARLLRAAPSKQQLTGALWWT